MLAFLTDSSKKGIEVKQNNQTVGLILRDGFCVLHGMTTFSPDNLLEIAERTRSHILDVELAKAKGGQGGH